MAKPFQENGAWAFRACIDGNRIYRGGFASEKAAREAQQQLVAEHKHLDTPTGLAGC